MHVRRVLCIDGYEDMCELLQSSLGQQGYETKSAHTLAHAWNLANSEKFDVYIIEKTYVDGTGLDFCRKLRAHDAECSVIFFCSDQHDPTAQEARQAGAHARLVNDGNFDKLVEIIRQL